MNDRRPIALPAELDAELALAGIDERAALVEAWILAGDAPADDPALRRAAWARLQSSLDDHRAPSRPALRLVPGGRHAMRYAMAAVMLALVAVSFLLRPGAIRHLAPEGVAVTEVRLPDGSTVQLGAGSVLRHAKSFGSDHRRVQLDGTAYFDVAHDEIPFVVETFSARIEVLGTAFNVRAVEGELLPSTTVDLDRGSVRVSSVDLPDLTVRLQPGEGTAVAQRSVPAPPVHSDTELARSWRSGGLSFANAPIGNVLDEIGRRYNVAISAPEDIRLGRVSLFRHSSATVDELLGDLADTAGLRYRRTAQGFDVYVP